MPSLMSMEDLFYGPSEQTWILPTRDEEPQRRYRERDFSPPRRYMKPEPQIRPVVRFDPRPPVERDIRPVARAEARPALANHELRPIERLARIHTVPEPVPVRAANEEIRKVVEIPVPTPVAPPTQVVVHPPPAPAPPVQVVQRTVAPRAISPPRSIIRHPIELKVPMCCEKCAKKVKDRLLDLEGVENVVTDQYNQKVVVHGHVDPARVLNRVKLVKKRSAFWDMTVDYSEKYRRARQVEADAVARESAKRAEVVKQKESQAKAMVAPVAVPKVVVNLPQEQHGPKVTAILPAAPKVVVNLPQEQHGPKVTAILPAEKESSKPYVVESRAHSERYVSPPKAYRQEFFHGPAHHEMHRRPEFYNGRHSVY